MWTPEQKATAGFKMMLVEGIEFTSKSGRPSLLVAFRSPEISHAVRDQLRADGFTVEVCPNQSWLEVK
jgi:hypothetical protein